MASVPLAIRDVLSSYGFPDGVVLAGSLYDVVHSAQRRKCGDVERFQTAIEEQFDADTAQLIRILATNDACCLHERFHSSPELFLLKLAILVQDASMMDSLQDDHLAQWAQEVEVMTQIDTDFLSKKYKESCKDMMSYLMEALEHYKKTEKASA